MSNRTIIELNHDYGHAIQRDPETFIRFLLSHINSANDPETIASLRHYGVVVVETVHHSTDRKVVIGNREFPL
jgi:translation initiation factor 2 beta subunit (eIF-2beta)/eIF-5